MSERAHIRDDWMMAGVSVVFVQETDSGRVVFGRDQAGAERVEVVGNTTMTESTLEPYLRMSDERARALLAALLRHYEGSDDQRQLRRDYDAERHRVDRFIDHLLTSDGAS